MELNWWHSIWREGDNSKEGGGSIELKNEVNTKTEVSILPF